MTRFWIHGVKAVCGNCRWHFDLSGGTEQEGVKNCLAQPAASCAEILSTEEADCNRPEDFQPSERTSYL